MMTDELPASKAEAKEYRRSDDLRTIELPEPEPLRTHARALAEALGANDRAFVQRACNAISKDVTEALSAPPCPVRVLGARPQEVVETSEYELFGDYDPGTSRIRVWMRTAVLKKPTSYGTLLSTLCHELCHHIDVVVLDMPNTFHTRGFYERAGLLYHHARGTPVRQLVWIDQADGTYRINWPETMRGRGR